MEKHKKFLLGSKLTFPLFRFETESKVDSLAGVQRHKDTKAVVFYMGVYNIHVCITLGIK